MNETDSPLTTLSNLLCNLLNCGEINPNEDLLDSGKLTSLTSMNLIIAIEDSFNIKVPNKELNRENFSTLNALTTMVQRLLANESLQTKNPGI